MNKHCKAAIKWLHFVIIFLASATKFYQRSHWYDHHIVHLIISAISVASEKHSTNLKWNKTTIFVWAVLRGPFISSKQYAQFELKTDTRGQVSNLDTFCTSVWKVTKSQENQKVLQILMELYNRHVKSTPFIITKTVCQFSMI